MMLKSNLIRGLIFFVFIFQFLFFYNFVTDYFFNKKVDAESKGAFFEVFKGDTSRDVAFSLKERGYISSSFLFNVYIKQIGKEESIKAGKYYFNNKNSISDIVGKMVFGDVVLDILKITIPEGSTLSQIDDKFRENGIIFEKKIADFRVSEFIDDFSFLSSVPKNASLEGFLFPDTYEFFSDNLESDYVVRVMLENFNSKLSKKMRKDILDKSMNIFDIVIIASILEREVKTFYDMSVVSGILYKRMSIGMPLQVDATTVYSLGGEQIKKGDLKKESPYNTYLNKGLPLGPISNPGINAIKAAVYPVESDFLFYISKPNGETVFSRDFKEHKKAINRYLK